MGSFRMRVAGGGKVSRRHPQDKTSINSGEKDLRESRREGNGATHVIGGSMQGRY